MLIYDQLTNLEQTNFCWENRGNEIKGHIKEKCLHFNGKWRQVCLACGRIEIDGTWLKVTEIDGTVSS